MKLHAVSYLGDSCETYRSTWAYRELFHALPRAGANCYGERPYPPQQLVRNIRILPIAFFSSIWLIVEEPVAEAWSSLPGVDLNPCCWEAVFDLPMDEAFVNSLVQRFSVFDESFSEWLEEQLAPVPPRVQKKKYFQVVAPHLETITANTKCDMQLELPSPPYEKLPPIPTSVSIHAANPILHLPPYYFFNDEAFHAVKRAFLDPELYLLRHLEI